MNEKKQREIDKHDDNFISEISLNHEFINILTGISGFAQLLNAKVKDRKACELTNAILQLSQRGSALLRHLRSCAAAGEADKMRVFAPNDLINSMVPLLKSLVPEDVQVEFCLDSRAGLVCGNQETLREVILTLTLMAAKALPEGSLLSLSTVAVEDEMPDTDSGRMEISFCSNGKMRNSEAGLRMAVEKAAADLRACGGRLKAESLQNDTVLELKVYLPCHTRKTFVGKDHLDSLPKGTETIMVVDDEGAILSVCENILVRLGYKVICCNSPENALAVRDGMGKIDLLLSDVIMPGWNGSELYQELEKMQPGLKIVYMSGYTNRGIMRAGALADGTPVLEKPFNVSALAVAVRNALDN